MNLLPLSVFILDKSDEDPAVLLGGTALEVADIDEDGLVIAECDYIALALASLDAFPDALCLKVHSSDGFGTFLFHEVEIYKGKNDELIADYMCIQPNKYWEGKWGLATFLGTIRDQIPFFLKSR